jgi:serine/threonine-protein kinase HipA
MTPVVELKVLLKTDSRERAVGRLAWVDRRILFEFDAAFIADPLPLSPFQLPVRPGVFEEKKRIFGGLFGLFEDSLPDGWGRLLLDREVERRGFKNLNPLDRLAFVGEQGPGALVYRPAWEEQPPAIVELQRLYQESEKVLKGSDTQVVPELLAAGGSSGGARPKVLVAWRPEDGQLMVGTREIPEGFKAVLVKFRSHTDPVEVGALELAYARLASAAGIELSHCWLVGASTETPGFFATERFDRSPRVHLHSLCGLLHADYRVPCLDYEMLLKTGRWLCRDQQVVEQLFLRAVFNVVFHNRDDHSRNTAFLMDNKGVWRLAPAFDLTFSSGPGGEHWMTVMEEGKNPGRMELLKLAKVAGIAEERATALIEQVQEVRLRAEPVMAEAGVSSALRKSVLGRLPTL